MIIMEQEGSTGQIEMTSIPSRHYRLKMKHYRFVRWDYAALFNNYFTGTNQEAASGEEETLPWVPNSPSSAHIQQKLRRFSQT